MKLWSRLGAFLRVMFSPASEPPPSRWPFVWPTATLPAVGDRLESAAINGAEAAKLLQNELLCWSLGEIRARIRVEMEAAPIRDTEGMQILRLWFDVAKAFEQNLASLITDGKLAEAELTQVARDREVEKRYGKLPV